jgi:hypothetical protein
MGDILWRNAGTGDIATWRMNGTQVSRSLGTGSASLIWTIQGADAD